MTGTSLSTPTEARRGQATAAARPPKRSPRRAALISLFSAADVVRRRLSHVVEAAGVTLQQYNVLRILRRAGDDGLATLAIAERMIEQTPGITRLLDRIEAKGWVRRERAAEDRRQVRCWITPDGLALVSALDEPVDAVDKLALQLLDGEEVSVLAGFLDRVRLSAQDGTASSTATAAEPGGRRSRPAPRPAAPVETSEPVLDGTVIERLRTLGAKVGQDVFAQVAAIYLERTPAQVEELAQALAAGDAGRLERLAHSLKGSSGNLGARRVWQLAAQLETTARDGALAAATAQIDALRAEVAAALDALAANLAQG